MAEDDHLLEAGKLYFKELSSSDPPHPVKKPGDVAWVLEPEGLKAPATFQLRGYIEPPALFGLPDGEMTVIPSNTEVLATEPMEGGGTIHRTLSMYRAFDDAIQQRVELAGGVRGDLSDNNLMVEVTAATAADAHAIAMDAIRRFVGNLSVSVGRRFAFVLAGMRVADEARTPVRLRRRVGGWQAAWYGLDELRANVEQDQVFARIDDERLNRALDYYTHAFFLTRLATDVEPTSRDHYLLQSAVFLNFWKAISTIVGDPSKDKDFQSRYKKLGLDYDFFENTIQRMKGLRDSLDVAHHSIDPTVIESIDEVRKDGSEAAQRIISEYRVFLANGNSF